jgi:antitoxin (DNA-binding transcriptional repressor) of toxin-antitoxin stability system
MNLPGETRVHESLSVLLERVNSGASLLICNKDEASANFHGQFDKHKCNPLDARQNLESIPRIKRGSTRGPPQ